MSFNIPDAYRYNRSTSKQGRAVPSKKKIAPGLQDKMLVLEHPFYKKAIRAFKRLRGIDTEAKLTPLQEKQFEYMVLTGKIIVEMPCPAGIYADNSKIESKETYGNVQSFEDVLNTKQDGTKNA